MDEEAEKFTLEGRIGKRKRNENRTSAMIGSGSRFQPSSAYRDFRFDITITLLESSRYVRIYSLL